MSDRYYKNDFDDYADFVRKGLSIDTGVLHEAVRCESTRTMDGISVKLDALLTAKDNSVYTGSAGLALLFLKSDRSDRLAVVSKIVESFEKHRRESGPTFLCGRVGPLVVEALFHNSTGTQPELKRTLERIAGYRQNVLSTECADELLYGRVGYLYALRFLQKELATEIAGPEVFEKIIAAIIESGVEQSRKDKSRSPLMFYWHGKAYLGAAHGLAGILKILLDCGVSGEASEKIRGTIEYLLTLKYPSGNFPSSLGSKDDRLVHWCHGAPGFVGLFASAFVTYGDRRYLEEAERCADVVWERGILKKGFGLCHGVAGNAYAFSTLYRVTKNEEYLYRAQRFAEVCMSDEYPVGEADSPSSLFEGSAGTAHFLLDMLRPMASAFIGFEV